MIDKKIHKDELKLRILVTDDCNQKCSFCLNDFQKKGDNQISEETVKNAITGYVESFNGKYPLQVYFSGGEPSLHKDIYSFIKFAKDNNCRTTLISNGYFTNALEKKLIEVTDCMHISAYKMDERLRDRAVRMNADIQCVYSSSNPYVDMEFLGFYASKGLRIKIFSDFFEDNYENYVHFVDEATEKFSSGLILARHTGIQENRGPGCDDCGKKCITLKAAWIYPDGSTSPCAQHLNTENPQSMDQWKQYFSRVEAFHKAQ